MAGIDLPESVATTVIQHRVGFHETDAMGIVHHANYLKFCENARVAWLGDHDKPYAEWIETGLHLAVIRVEIDYRRATKFDEALSVTTWLEWVRGASLAMGYRITSAEELVATGRTEHASVDSEGRVRRIPKEVRLRLSQRASESS